MLLELRHLRTLLAIHEAGSLAGAAARVHLTQSAISHQMRALEAHYGVPLLFRPGRPARLTPAGEHLLALARELLPAVERAEHNLACLAAGQAGRLHVTIECHACFDWLLPVLDDFRARWPEVDIDIRMPGNFDALPALLGGEIDLVITSDPAANSALHFEPLFGYRAVLAMHPDHRLAQRPWIDPRDLATETLITYPVPSERLDVFTHFLVPAGVEPAAVRQCELTAVLLQLVANRRGVAALPDWVLRAHLEAGTLVARALGSAGMGGRMFAAVRTAERDRPWLVDFIGMARSAER